MPQGGETPGLEQVPQLPEQAVETAPAAASFEAPVPAPEQPLAPAPPVPQPAAAPPPTPAGKDAAQVGVERVLEEGLAEVYKKMDAHQQRKFSHEGDRVASALAEMVRRAKVRAREALDLITRWLRLIPGVNAFYLAQEAKLKTDKIIALAEDEKKKQGVL